MLRIFQCRLEGIYIEHRMALKDYMQLPPFMDSSLEAFMRDREKVYEERRQRVVETCQKMALDGSLQPFQVYLEDHRAQPLMHIPDKKLFYCQIAKVNQPVNK